MPLIDLPIEELKCYQGRNPIPKDYEQYWESAIAKMKALEGNVTMTKADFQVPIATCYDLTFIGVGGAKIYAKCVIPKSKGKKPGVVRFHGYTMGSDDWAELVKYAALGMVVANMDCRGQGGYSEDIVPIKGPSLFGHIVRGVQDNPDKLLYRDIFLDTAQLAGIVMDMEEVDETRVAAVGGSQGGALTIACAALEPRIKLALAVYPFLCDYKRVWEMDLAKDAFNGIHDYLRRFDPRHEHVDEFFETLGYIDLQHMAHRIKAEVIMVTGLMDTICPPSTQFAMYNKITSKKDVIIYPDFGHEFLPGWSSTELQYLMNL